MKKRTSCYPRVHTDAAAAGVVSSAGVVLLLEAVRASGVDVALSEGLQRWRKPTAVHDPAKVLLDLALTLATGGDCLADIALLRGQPGVFGPVASDPTVSRAITALAADAPAALKAINTARAVARAGVWQMAGRHAPDHDADQDHPIGIDLDATLVAAHSEKEHAAPTFKRGFGFHPLWAFCDHGQEGTGEPLAVKLRAGNAGSNTVADHIEVTKLALAQLPGHQPGTRPGRGVLIRADAAGGTHGFLEWLTSQRLSYSVGFSLPDDIAERLQLIPNQVWQPAIDAEEKLRDGAWVAEVTGVLDPTIMATWPKGMRVIVRKERPHPGAQLRFTDVDGHRLTAFATNTRSGGGPGRQVADLELRHRRRARAEDRIRCAKDTGLTNLPLHGFAQNQIWCALVALACELTAWAQLLAFPVHQARRWEPKRLRLRLLSAGGRLVHSGRRWVLHYHRNGAWTQLLLEGLTRLRALLRPVAVPG